MKSLKRVMLAITLMLSLTAISALAQDEEQPYPDQDQAQYQAPVEDQQASQPARSDQNDPPGRAARLQYMSGSVSIQPRGTEDWVAGSLNRPLTIADNVWTDKESRAELNVGTGVMRMGDETSLTLTNVSDSTVQVELHQGTLDVHVRHLFGGEIYEIDTPNMAFTIQKSGVYRVDVDPNGDASVVTVRKGEGDATGQGPAVRVKSNQQVRFTDGTSMTHSVAEAPAYDGFDDWCAVRDKREDSSLSARYVAQGTVGYEDLDDYGVWREEPMYGHVWVPVVAPGWAPYQAGHWIWVEPWGWTWVDDAPWGYAPFHYGRWVYTGGYWGWAPGPIYARPVYAPALVAWFGGPGWGVNFGFGAGGGLGWCALGWGEPFYPWYHGGYNYFRGINVSNTRIVNIHNYWGHPPNRFGGGNFHYANMRAPGGITTAPVRTLQNGMAVRGTAVRMSARDFAGAPMGRVGVTPTRNAMLGVHAGQRAATPPTRSGMRPVVARMSPPASFNRGRTSGGGQKPFAGRSEPLTPSRIIPHGAESASGRVPSPAVRGTVARPSDNNAQRQGMNRGDVGRSNNPQRPMMNNPQGGRENSPQIARNVPRPPMGGMQPSRAPESRGPVSNGPQSRGGFSPSQADRSVPRPPANFGGGSRQSQPGMSSRSDSRPGMGSYGNRPNTAVPRPTGPVRPASQSERATGNGGWTSNRGASSAPQYRGSNSSPSYRGGNNSPSRGDSPRYSAPPTYRNSGPSYGGSGSINRGGSPYGGGSPSYRSAPSRSTPSYGGGSPSYRSAPSYGVGSPSYRSAPSYGGGYRGAGAAPSYHGGGGGAPSYHGGGGGAPASHGGGGNSGGGGRSSSGGGHGSHR